MAEGFRRSNCRAWPIFIGWQKKNGQQLEALLAVYSILLRGVGAEGFGLR
jgi:hypothetical protein